jgi:hypothetical protein
LGLSLNARRVDIEIGVPAKSTDAFKTIAFGLLWLAGVAWMVASDSAPTPIGDLRLTLNGATTSGEIIETWQEVEDSDSGADSWSSGIAYRFRVPDGRQFVGVSRGSNPLRPDLANLNQPIPAEVQYHPDDPSLNRLSDDEGLFGWLRRTAAFMILPGLLFFPGIFLLKQGLQNLLGVQPDVVSEALRNGDIQIEMDDEPKPSS